MKTAVEWLIYELRNKHGLSIDLYSEFAQAKEMEKEQIIKSILDNRNITSQVTYLDAEKYYNETFKQ
jgi:hypothetical protein